MPNNWYTSREIVKRTLGLNGADNDPAIERQIVAASREIDRELGRRDGHFIPETKTRNFAWPQDPDVHDRHVKSFILRLDEGLISLTSITGEGTDLVTIPTSELFLEPANEGPPHWRIEIDKATTNAAAIFQAGDTTQRAIRVVGSWGHRADTLAAGTVASGLASDATATTFVCSDGSLIDVGDTLLIQSEQVFVSGRAFAALGSILVNDAGITADVADTSITVDGSHGIVAGEIIQLDSERMYVVSVATNVLTVGRGYDGTVLATHADDTAVQINRTLTVTRGVNGTTAATHANTTAVSKYDVPAPIRRLATAIVIENYEQDKGGRTGTVGSGEGAIRLPRDPLASLWEKTKREYGRSIALIL